jgi:hypothetical protein
MTPRTAAAANPTSTENTRNDPAPTTIQGHTETALYLTARTRATPCVLALLASAEIPEICAVRNTVRDTLHQGSVHHRRLGATGTGFD